MITDSDITKLKETFATKDDLKGFATKDDLKGFATKDDLKSFATKDDLKSFATKDDLKSFATKTKNDLKSFATKNDLKEAVADLRVEIGEVRDTVEATAVAVGRIEIAIDGLAGAIQDQRTENGAGAAHLARHDRQIEALAFATSVALPD